MRMRYFFGFLFSVLVCLLILGCEPENLPQARHEENKLSCPIDKELKARLDEYFKSIPRTPPDGKGWIRAIVLKKNLVFTNEMSVSVLLYTTSGELKTVCSGGGCGRMVTLPSDRSLIASKIDILTFIGSEIWFKGEYLCPKDIQLITERAVCISESLVILSSDK